MVKKAQFQTRQKGQALLIVVLVMVVALTIGLALVTRSITNLRTSVEEDRSQRAFSAAEAGVEQAVKVGANGTIIASSNPKDLGNNASIKQLTVNTLSGDSFLVNNGTQIEQDDGADIWLVPHNGDSPNYALPWPGTGTGTLTLYWTGSNNSCNDAALEIITISGSLSSPTASHSVYDPCQTRANNNKFTYLAQSAPFSLLGTSFVYKTTVTITSGLAMRVIPLYTGTRVGVVGSSVLPVQGQVITSTGASGATERKLTVFKGYPKLPAEFYQYVLFSPNPKPK